MPNHHLVVDGSNIATEGRSLPSLRQLDEAVQAFLNEFPHDQLTVVVDATFGHRIDASERAEFEEAVRAGELLSPPAGTIGRGDAFVLQIADRADATILSNDSFQEFHPQYGWLFDDGRLIGGKPVPGVGWIFMPRTPVRGPTSRKAERDARGRGGGNRSRDGGRQQQQAGGRQRRSDRPQPPRPPARPEEILNEPLPFIEFVGAHPIGTAVDGTVLRFSSHGAYVEADGVECYIPLRHMGDPPPRAARDALSLGEHRRFVVFAVDTPRRGIDLALAGPPASKRPPNPAAAPATEKSAGEGVVSDDAPPSIELHKPAPSNAPPSAGKPGRRRRRRRGGATQENAGDRIPAPDGRDIPDSTTIDATHNTTNVTLATDHTDTTTRPIVPAEEGPVTPPAKKAAAKKAAAKKAPAKKAPAKKAPAKKAPAKKAPAKKAPAKAPAKKAPAKAPAKKAPAKAPAKKAPAKAPAKKAPAKKAPAKKAPAKKAPAKAPAKKAPAKAPAKKAPAKKAPAKKR